MSSFHRIKPGSLFFMQGQDHGAINRNTLPIRVELSLGLFRRASAAP